MRCLAFLVKFSTVNSYTFPITNTFLHIFNTDSKEVKTRQQFLLEAGQYALNRNMKWIRILVFTFAMTYFLLGVMFLFNRPYRLVAKTTPEIRIVRAPVP